MTRNPYLRPTLRRPRKVRIAGSRGVAAGPIKGVGVRAVEVIQSIQSIDNNVRLIAGKVTLVRVYLDPASLAAPSLLTGELVWRRGAGGMRYLPAMNRLNLTPSSPLISLQEQRFDTQLSINFRLPPEATSVGELEIGLQRLFVPGGDDVPIATPARLIVRFHSAPPLRVRVVGLRYKSATNPPSHVTPDAIHFTYLNSYLNRAYPVATVEWSQIVIDADMISPPFGAGASDLVNAQLSALRAREISSGIDPRTHYYGLVDNERGGEGSFMRGSAVYNLQTRVFDVVASGPSGTPNGWSGDSDASFADWYGAHELGHTYQRRHPGFPVRAQPRDPDETGFPYPDGLITTLPDNRFVGLDVGDVALGLPMQALPGNRHHDVMTYADRQWLSAYTYEAIYHRLMEEDTQLAPVIS
jgi:hypothetical protein